MYGYVYLTTNQVNGKVYVGQHRAEAFDAGYKGSGDALWAAIRKYGWKNFSVEMIDQADTQEQLDRKEIFWIEQFRSTHECYNIAKGGAGVSGVVYTEEVRKRMSDSHKKWAALPENRAKMAESQRGRVLSEETRNKISIANRGKHSSTKGKKNPKVSAALKGRKRPDISAALKGKKRPDIAESNRRRVVSDETRRKMSEAHRKKD